MRLPSICLILITVAFISCEGGIGGSGGGVDMSSPRKTANSFYNAAKTGDDSAVQSLCKISAQADALDVAEKIRAGDLPKPSWRKMEADPSLEGLQAVWAQQVIAIEMENVDGDWKIVTIALSGI